MYLLLQAFRFLSLVLAGLALGPAFSHLLEMPAKLTLSPNDYLIVQRIYTAFGAVGAIVEPGAVASAIVLAFLVRRRRAFYPTLVGALCLVAALLIWVAIVNPVNAHWQATGSLAVPDNFESLRLRWEWGHAARAGLLFVAFVSLVVTVLLDLAGDAAAAVRLTVPQATTKNATSASERRTA